MGANWKALPLFAKCFILCLLAAGLYQFSHLSHSVHRPSSAFTDAGNDPGPDQDGEGRRNQLPDQSSERYPQNQALAQFQTQQSQLMARVRQCQSEMTQATNAMGAAAMQGQMYNRRPLCEQSMPQWIAQEAYLETEIYRIQTGDRSSSLRQITGIAGPSATTGNSSGARPSGDGTEAVDNWDREAIRGNSLYTDESGEQHELPTRNHYFRDRSSGQMVGSDSPDRPNDGRDYEVLTYSNHPQ